MTTLKKLPEQIVRIITSSATPATDILGAFKDGKIPEFPHDLLGSYFSYGGGILDVSRAERSMLSRIDA